jgi:hypothetical protein
VEPTARAGRQFQNWDRKIVAAVERLDWPAPSKTKPEALRSCASKRGKQQHAKTPPAVEDPGVSKNRSGKNWTATQEQSPQQEIWYGRLQKWKRVKHKNSAAAETRDEWIQQIQVHQNQWLHNQRTAPTSALVKKGENRFLVLRLATERTRGIPWQSENSEAGEPKDQAGGELRKLTPESGSANENQSWSKLSQDRTGNEQGSLNRRTQIWQMCKQTKMNSTMTRCKKRSFIELRQNLHTTEVTTFPPSFDWNQN